MKNIHQPDHRGEEGDDTVVQSNFSRTQATLRNVRSAIVFAAIAAFGLGVTGCSGPAHNKKVLTPGSNSGKVIKKIDPPKKVDSVLKKVDSAPKKVGSVPKKEDVFEEAKETETRFKHKKGVVRAWYLKRKNKPIKKVYIFAHGLGKWNIDQFWKGYQLKEQFKENRVEGLLIAPQTRRNKKDRKKYWKGDSQGLVNFIASKYGIKLDKDYEIIIMDHSSGCRTAESWLSNKRVKKIASMDCPLGSFFRWSKGAKDRFLIVASSSSQKRIRMHEATVGRQKNNPNSFYVLSNSSHYKMPSKESRIIPSCLYLFKNIQLLKLTRIKIFRLP